MNVFAQVGGNDSVVVELTQEELLWVARLVLDGDDDVPSRGDWMDRFSEPKVRRIGKQLMAAVKSSP